ncbi:hypothetical protein L7F22_027161 [Adiantum nelumboides]|nr:hypothetical protein [Adiantum nelumboides]
MPMALFGGNKGVHATIMTCMDAKAEILGEGLIICTPTCKPASSSIVSSKTAPQHVEQILPILLEQETAPISVLSVEVTACAPCVPSTPMSTTLTETQMAISTASNTPWDNRCRVLSDSEGQFKSSQTSPLPSCTNEKKTLTRNFRLRDFCQLPCPLEVDSAYHHCTYVNIENNNENQTLSKKKSSCHNLHASVHAGKLANWSRVVKPEVALDLEESWPPLLPTTKKEDTYKRLGHEVKPNVNAEPRCKNSILYSSCQYVEDGVRPTTVPLHASREVELDNHCWPSLDEQSILCRDYGISRKRTLQPLSPTNTSTAQQQRSKPHGGLYKAQDMHLPPILLMVNKDFIVTSPLKENLLLTLALMGRQSTANTPENAEPQCLQGTKKQVLVGQFKAFSSFLHFILGHDATRVRTESNAGGTSTISECLSVEYFVRRFQAKDIVTEMEVEYCSFNWKKVDFICTLYGQRVGISVTRAMSFPDPKDFSAQMAYRLLHKKLFGLVVARHGVSKRHSFSQCILHVWCETQQTADLMQREYDAVSRELDIADDVVMVLTVADGFHARPIFYESLLRNGAT